MTIKNANLDGILAELTRRKSEKQAGEQGDRDTTHPIADAPNSTQDASTGASASEDSSDVKDQQPIGVENTGGPVTEANPSGSMGVEDKKPDEGADLDNGDTKGTSEMANTGTTHPSADGTKRGSADEALAILDAAIKKAEAQPEEKTAEEKLAAYAKELETEHADAVADGEKFAEHVLNVLQSKQNGAEKTAAQVIENKGAIKQLLKLAASKEDVEKLGDEGFDKLAMAMAEQGVAPEELEAALAAEAGAVDPAVAGAVDPAVAGAVDPAVAGTVDPAMAGAGEEVELAQLAAALEEAGITPEILEAALAQDSLGEEEQGAALDAAMGEAGVSPEEIAAAGGELPMEVVGSADKVKIASDKQAAFLALKNRLVTELKQLKEGATK